LIADERRRTVAKPARNSDRSAECPEELRIVVRRLLGLLARERKRPRIPRRIAQEHADAAVVERTPAAAVVAKRGELSKGRRGAVVEAAVDQETVRRAKWR